MNTVDRVVEEHGVIAGPVLRVLLRFVGDVNVSTGQKLTTKAIDFFSASRSGRDVIDADRLIVCVSFAPVRAG